MPSAPSLPLSGLPSTSPLSADPLSAGVPCFTAAVDYAAQLKMHDLLAGPDIHSPGVHGGEPSALSAVVDVADHYDSSTPSDVAHLDAQGDLASALGIEIDKLVGAMSPGAMPEEGCVHMRRMGAGAVVDRRGMRVEGCACAEGRADVEAG